MESEPHTTGTGNTQAANLTRNTGSHRDSLSLSSGRSAAAAHCQCTSVSPARGTLSRRRTRSSGNLRGLKARRDAD
eukprot:1340765-Rhodomonas_salina.1